MQDTGISRGSFRGMMMSDDCERIVFVGCIDDDVCVSFVFSSFDEKVLRTQ